MDSNSDVNAGDSVFSVNRMTVGRYDRTAARIPREERERIVEDSWSINVSRVVFEVTHFFSCVGSSTKLKQVARLDSSKKGIQGTKASYLDRVSMRDCR
jgi:hypothetical protein